MVAASNIKYLQFIAEDSEINLLEKANPVGAVTKEDIADALSEYDQQFRIGQISKAELLTLHRAYPSNQEYAQAALQKGIIGDEDSPAIVIGGPASVEMVDREGHLITMEAMQKAFDKFMSNNRTRNVMVLHSDVQVGWALPAYINSSGQIFKSGVNDDRLFLLSEIRDDTKISQRVVKQIEDGKLHSYSIAGSAIQTQTIQKGMVQYMQVDELELAEITVCEQGVNQGANFDILKGHAYTGSCIDGSCLLPLEKDNTPFKMEELELMFKEDGSIDFFDTLIQKLDDDDVEIPRGNNVNSEDDEHDGEFIEKIKNPFAKKPNLPKERYEQERAGRLKEYKERIAAKPTGGMTGTPKPYSPMTGKASSSKTPSTSPPPAASTSIEKSGGGNFIEKLRRLYKQEEGEQLPLPKKISQQSYKDHVRDAYKKFTGAGKWGATADAPNVSTTPHEYSTDKEVMERGKGALSRQFPKAKGWKANQRAAGEEYDKDVSMSKAEETSEKPNNFELKPKLPKGTEGGGTRETGLSDKVKPKVPMHPNVLRRIRDKYTDMGSEEGAKKPIWSTGKYNQTNGNIEKAEDEDMTPEEYHGSELKPKMPKGTEGGEKRPKMNANKLARVRTKYPDMATDKKAKIWQAPGYGGNGTSKIAKAAQSDSSVPFSWSQNYKDHVRDKYKDFTAPGASDGPPSMVDALRQNLGHPPKDKAKLESSKGWKASARAAQNAHAKDIEQATSKQPKPETDIEKAVTLAEFIKKKKKDGKFSDRFSHESSESHRFWEGGKGGSATGLKFTPTASRHFKWQNQSPSAEPASKENVRDSYKKFHDHEMGWDRKATQNTEPATGRGRGGGLGPGSDHDASGKPMSIHDTDFSVSPPKPKNPDGGSPKPETDMEKSSDGDFIQNLKALLKEGGGPLAGHSFVGLQNEGGRRELHSHFLRELGFPEEVHEDTMRYSPVSEENPLSPWRKNAPWKVNEAGSEMHMPIDTPSHGDVAPLAHNQVGMTKSAIDSFIEWENNDN